MAAFKSIERDLHNRSVIECVEAWVGLVASWAVMNDPAWAAKTSKPGLLLYGPPGVGKSWIGACVVNALVDVGVAARFLKTVGIPKHDTDAVEELADIGLTPVLVLDDLGAEKLTERALECLYMIVDGRAHSEAPTLVTTNWKPESLKRSVNAAGAGYGDKLLSRLSGLCEFVPVGGPDRRKM